MAVTPFKRSVHFDTQKKSKGGGGGNWYDVFKLPQTSAAPFVLINTEYVDPNPPKERVQYDDKGQPLSVKNSYFKFRQHTRKVMKNGKEWFAKETCSQGHDPHNPKPCAGCMAMDMGDKSVSVSDKFAIGIVHLSPYHRHPLYDKQTGQIRMKKGQDGAPEGPIYTYTECSGRTCNFCKILSGQPPVLKPKEFWPEYNPAEVMTEFGHRRYIEIGKNHLSNLEGWDSAVMSQCCAPITNNGQFLARCSQQLFIDSYNCPECDTVVIDVANDPREAADIERAVMKPHPCLKCQKGVMLVEVASCDACKARGQNHAQLGMFDVVLWGKRQGEGTKSQLMLQQFQTIDEFQKNLPPHIVTMLGGKSVSEVITQLSNPYDFDRIFEAKPVEEQAKRLELNVASPTQSTSAYSQSVNGPTHMTPGPVPFMPTIKPNFNK